MNEPGNDRWLDRWLPLIAQRAGNQPILELGCGAGRDSVHLVNAGHAVVGIDLSSAAIEIARSQVPAGRFYCQDFRAPFPVPPGVGVVVASLCLHYFPWEETVALVDRILDHLRPDGAMLCRLNSTKDTQHGATGHPRIGDNFYLVDGVPKRFFDRAAIDALFARGWRVLSLEEKFVDRYAQTKALWEVILEPAT